MVGEELVEQKVEEISSSPEVFLSAFRQMQPVLYGYLMSEQFGLLAESERELLLFMALVIWASLKEEGSAAGVVSEEEIGRAEEENWTLWLDAGGGPFRHRLDVFFNDYAQEDLLAYVEDSLLLTDGEEVNELGVTSEGRELLFISLKTVIDVLQ